MISILLLIAAGLLAGALNAVAGGGTFLSFPALVWVGVPPVIANATATLSALPGYIGSAFAYRRDIRPGAAIGLPTLLALTVIGGLLGALLLLVTPSQVFSGVVPWLLLLATLAFATGPTLLRLLLRQGKGLARLPAMLLLTAICIYGGYFNGGLGIMLLAGFGLIGLSNLHQMNGLKNLLSAILSLVAVATYIAAGLIDWPTALILAPSCAVGGVAGAWAARRIRNMAALRVFITVTGLAMTVAFFLS